MSDNIFNISAHNPSFFAVQDQLGKDREILDFCVPVNGYFPPPRLTEDIRDNLPNILKFYPDQGAAHDNALAEFTGLPAENLVPANGSTELITQLCRRAEAPIMTTVPTFGRWTDLPKDFGKAVTFLQRRRENGFVLSADDVILHARANGSRTVIICNPDNPTGCHFTSEDIERILRELSDIPMIIIDESFIDFADLDSASSLAITWSSAARRSGVPERSSTTGSWAWMNSGAKRRGKRIRM